MMEDPAGSSALALRRAAYNATADVLRTEVRDIILAAMARDATIKTIEVRLGISLSSPSDVGNLWVGVSDRRPGGPVRDAVVAAIRRRGWRYVLRGQGALFRGIVVSIDRLDISAHEIARAVRRVAR